MDTQEIKSKLLMLDLLDHYGITGLKQRNEKLSGPCPIHNGDNPNSFHVSLAQNLWHCFTRDHGGDVFSFIMEYEQVNFRKAVDIARAILNGAVYEARQSPCQIPPAKPQALNQPLKFKLKLDPEHGYLFQRGLTRETISHFGLGYCSRGYLQGRIAIPIHDHKNLVAYAGRSVNNENPKYKFPRGFSKSLVLFNLHHAKHLETESLIIVEGFFGCFKIHQAGLPNVVALMGCSASKEQINLFLQLGKKLILLLDGDQAGRSGTEKLIQTFRGKLPFVVKYLPDGVQPDQLHEQELSNLLKERS